MFEYFLCLNIVYIIIATDMLIDIPFSPFSPLSPSLPSWPSTPGIPILPTLPLGPAVPGLPGGPWGPGKLQLSWDEWIVKLRPFLDESTVSTENRDSRQTASSNWCMMQLCLQTEQMGPDLCSGEFPWISCIYIYRVVHRNKHHQPHYIHAGCNLSY